ncbi:MAG: DUF4433 domain-containing protein [Proteobacteria bacterium]|nr:DUF4433 domain-containing protein [Pseudomonadota bacterium]
MPAPASPKIYHITAVQNLPSIVANGLRSDVAMIAAGGPARSIGMGQIKTRRLLLPVTCHQGLMVGGCVPFYFCSRSIMLYIMHKGNHENVAYRGGQGPILHLEADMHATIAWARNAGRRWAFSLSNAGAAYTEFRRDVAQLDEIDWPAVAAHQWNVGNLSHGKQAEFLVENEFPWALVERIGVQSRATYGQVQTILENAHHRPRVEIKPDWYY